MLGEGHNAATSAFTAHCKLVTPYKGETSVCNAG